MTMKIHCFLSNRSDYIKKLLDNKKCKVRFWKSGIFLWKVGDPNVPCSRTTFSKMSDALALESARLIDSDDDDLASARSLISIRSDADPIFIVRHVPPDEKLISGSL